MFAIRLVVCDLDGTLLEEDGEPSPPGVEALQRVQRSGVAVALATGRMLRSAQTLQRRMGLAGPVLAYNGGLVWLAEDRQWQHPLTLQVAQRIAAYSRQRGWLVQSFIDEQLIVPWQDERTTAYSRRAGVPVVVDPAAVYSPRRAPVKLLLLVPAAERDRVIGELAERFAGEVSVSGSQPEYVEVNGPGVDKGVGLRELATALGVALQSTLAIGDGLNDVPMLRSAGWGAAVANAGAEVRAAARWVSAHGYGAGVAEIVAHFLDGDAGRDDGHGR